MFLYILSLAMNVCDVEANSPLFVANISVMLRDSELIRKSRQKNNINLVRAPSREL